MWAALQGGVQEFKIRNYIKEVRGGTYKQFYGLPNALVWSAAVQYDGLQDIKWDADDGIGWCTNDETYSLAVLPIYEDVK